ncbi:hypothetical protein M409DRAFT_58671 [Zasmidium cellare ATCC 36951]|uniref:Uncharacterized protein n=1 Tax=Zasmidium cellare ATCC 36951 TaxID=1080233 RepID=A0A6A6C6R8_ZASCE|nr:uncharacterized protein M409DRAFT_58671 [Zasmidium cellare ATCC 36951]KAF2161890.1 hypothetical protein M409DRAFT_58671 [Zasmidium cellare ATCC 36951]
MCFQGFAHHSCGCTKLFEEECDYAKELETAPFYLKVACPNYAVARRYPPFECGKGGLYCENTPDATYLDQVFDFKTKLETEAMATDKYINEYIHPRRKIVLDTLEKQYFGDMAKIKQAYTSNAVFADLDQKWTIALHKKADLTDKIAAMNSILRYAREFYLLQRQLPGYTPASMPVLPDYLKNFRVEAPRPAPIQPPSANMITPLSALQAGVAVAVGMGLAIGTHSGILQPQPIRPQSLPGPDPFGPTTAGVQVEQKKLQPSLQAPAVKESPRKRRRPAKKAKAAENTAEDASPDLRRSTRVRGKKVDYNETSDDLESAASSPEKSDVSAYSPSKSDVSDQGVKPSRGSSSLRDMIGEYQKQSGNVSTPTRRPPSQGQTGSASSQNRGLLDNVPQIRVDSPRSDTPDTDILQPDDPRYDGGMQAPTEKINHNSAFAPSAFRPLPNGNPDPALLAFQQAYQQTRVSAGNNLNTSQGIINDLRRLANPHTSRSPSQRDHSMPPATISPPKLVQYNIPTDPAEPRKRPIPASSPILPSNKRVELSFPSSYTTPTYYNQNPAATSVSMSSPQKPTYMHRQDSGMGYLSPPKAKNMGPPPPPIFIPTTNQTFKPSGLSQVSPVQDVFSFSSATAPAGDLLPTATEGGGDVEDSDFDWALLGDGSKF